MGNVAYLPPFLLGRGLVAYPGRKRSGYSVKDIARYFRREPMTISQGVAKVERVLGGNGDLAKEVGGHGVFLVLRENL